MLTYQSTPVLSPILGEIVLPGDKSISHRALFFGAIAEGKTIISGFLPSEDCLATLRIFRSMGVQIEFLNETTLCIEGVGLHGLQSPQGPLDCGNSGTTMRLLMGLLAAQPFDSILVGDESLHRRPMARVSTPLNQMGATIQTSPLGCAPIYIQKNTILSGINYTLPVASAQLKSALLLAGLYCSSPLSVREPVLTRDHTERLFTWFGCPLKKKIVKNNASDAYEYTVFPGSYFVGRQVDIPGDFSSAAFFIVAATLIEGSDLTLRDVGFNPTRTGLLPILRNMGADIEVTEKNTISGEPSADIRVRYAKLQGTVVPETSVSLMIDEFPILFVAAATAKGITEMTGLSELRHKESDRISGMIEGLRQLGVRASISGDHVLIEGGEIQGGVVSALGDHRLAMAFLIAGAVAKKTVTVLDCQSITTSFPSFFSTAKTCQFLLQQIGNDNEHIS
jgi:3-phosphoshikimate 1-carboxyvinyltransferase